MPLLTVRSDVAGACVDDRSIAENAYFDVLWRQATYCHRSGGLRKKLVFVDQ